MISDTTHRCKVGNKSLKIVLDFVGVTVIKCIKIHNGYTVCSPTFELLIFLDKTLSASNIS